MNGAFDDASDEYISFNTQLTHKYKHGSDIEFHLHTALPTAPSANDSVVWEVTYSWADIGEAFPTETTTTVVTDVQSLSANTHYLTEIIDQISGSGKEGSSVLLCSLTRDADHASDTYDYDIYLVALDFHIEIDKIGSDNEQP